MVSEPSNKAKEQASVVAGQAHDSYYPPLKLQLGGVGGGRCWPLSQLDEGIPREAVQVFDS